MLYHWEARINFVSLCKKRWVSVRRWSIRQSPTEDTMRPRRDKASRCWQIQCGTYNQNEAFKAGRSLMSVREHGRQGQEARVKFHVAFWQQTRNQFPDYTECVWLEKEALLSWGWNNKQEMEKKIKISCAWHCFRWRKERRRQRLQVMYWSFYLQSSCRESAEAREGEGAFSQILGCEGRFLASSAREALESEYGRRGIFGEKELTWREGWSKSFVWLFHRVPQSVHALEEMRRVSCSFMWVTWFFTSCSKYIHQ